MERRATKTARRCYLNTNKPFPLIFTPVDRSDVQLICWFLDRYWVLDCTKHSLMLLQIKKETRILLATVFLRGNECVHP